MDGWIKLFRKFKEWGWYRNSNVKDLFLEILLTANFEDKPWQKIIVKRGQLVTSVGHLSDETGLTVRQVRTALDNLKLTNELTIETTTKYTLLTINKYNDYQQMTNELTNERQTNDKRTTTTKEYKNKRIKEEKMYTSSKLTLEQVANGILEAFNLYLGKEFKGIDSFKNNLEYWLNTYDPAEIENAIKNIKYDKWWKDKMTPVMLFRRRNPQGESVDYISSLLINSKDGYSRTN